MGFYSTETEETHTRQRSYPRAVAASVEPDPFGSLIASTEGTYIDSTGGNAFRFSTKYWDGETGLGYWGYRYLQDGRWLSPDPIGEVGFYSNILKWSAVLRLEAKSERSPDLYVYVRNSPVQRMDVLGLGILCDCPFDSQAGRDAQDLAWRATLGVCNASIAGTLAGFVQKEAEIACTEKYKVCRFCTKLGCKWRGYYVCTDLGSSTWYWFGAFSITVNLCL